MNPKNLSLLIISIFFTLFLMGYKVGVGLVWGWYPIVLSTLVISSLIILASGTIDAFSQFLKVPKLIREYAIAIPPAIVLTFIIWIQVDYYRNSSGLIYSLSPILKPNNFESILITSVLIFFFFLVFFGRQISSRINLFYLVGSIFIGMTLIGAYFSKPELYPKVKARDFKPHILILSFDSLQSSIVNEKENFPFLNSIKDEFLVANNFYSNSCCTHGSIATLYTGSTPLKTKVAYPPAQLQGRFTTYNLPMALRMAGYTTNSFTTEYWANARELGISSSFDSISGTKKGFLESGLILNLFGEPGPLRRPIQAFAAEIAKRINRFYLGEQRNFSAFAEVNDQKIKGQADEDKLKDILELVDRMSSPQFIHTHFMTLHGVHGDSKALPWVARDFDNKIEQVYQKLERTKNLENTILIITSDHGIRWNSATPIPLWIRFPKKVRRGSLERLAQMADVAPTLLKYTKIETDISFEGIDLLDSPAIVPRTIYSVSDVTAEAPLQAPNFMMNGLWQIRLGETKKIPVGRFKLSDDGSIFIE